MEQKTRQITEEEKKAMLAAILESGKIIMIRDPENPKEYLLYSRSPVDLKKTKPEDIIFLD